MEDNTNLNKSIQNRLRRIEGQVKGIERMLDNEVCCKDILVQVAAVRAAVNKVGTLILQNYAENCLLSDVKEERGEEVEQLVNTITMFLK
ncbi:metal-sensitive transcriptional regulator [Clostridium sediminicola]|uniref:metal-sensitive transcriptional regulator n=1 Tax=Clostridium sediminicola TaxID=3114879 RepID=UPI0031F1E992